MKRSDQELIEELIEDDPRDALRHVHQLVETGEDDPELQALEAECLAAAGEHNAALRAWAAYITVDPDYAGAYAERARLLIELGRRDAAESEIRAAEEIFGARAEILFQQGFLADSRGDFEAADTLYDAAAALHETLDAPPRLDQTALETALKTALQEALASDRLTVTVTAMPTTAEEEGIGRLFDRVGQNVVVYQRNLERDLAGISNVEDAVEMIVELLQH